MKKDILITIRFSKMEKDLVAQIKTLDPTFTVSKFLRASLEAKAKELIEQSNKDGIGNLKVG